MVRKLTEAKKLSSRTTSKQFHVYGSKCIKPVNSLNFRNIDELYDLSKEDKLTKTVQFIANQLVHGSALYAYRDKNRNWGGVYTCSDLSAINMYIKSQLLPLSKYLKLHLKITLLRFIMITTRGKVTIQSPQINRKCAMSSACYPLRDRSAYTPYNSVYVCKLWEEHCH